MSLRVISTSKGFKRRKEIFIFISCNFWFISQFLLLLFVLSLQRNFLQYFRQIPYLEGNVSSCISILHNHRKILLLLPLTHEPLCRFPYFLPCLIISLLALPVAIACFWIPVCFFYLFFFMLDFSFNLASQYQIYFTYFLCILTQIVEFFFMRMSDA